MNTRTKEGFSQIVIYMGLFGAALIIIIWGCASYWSWNDVYDFIFISMKTHNPVSQYYPASQAPSFISTLASLLPLLTVIFGLVYVSKQISGMKSADEIATLNSNSRQELAKANSAQAAALQTQADAMIIRAKSADKNFDFELFKGNMSTFRDTVKLLTKEHTIVQWLASLTEIKDLAKANPDMFFDKSIEVLCNVGKEFGGYVKQHKLKIKTYDNYMDMNRFSINILGAITEIRDHKNCVSFSEKPISIYGFYAPYKTEFEEMWDMRFINFENFIFSNCDFSGLNIFGCNFYKAEFYNCTGFNINFSVLSGGKILHGTNLFWEKSAFTFEARNYVWEDDLGTLSQNVNFLENNFYEIKKEFFNEWRELGQQRSIDEKKWIDYSPF